MATHATALVSLNLLRQAGQAEVMGARRNAKLFQFQVLLKTQQKWRGISH